MIQVLHGDCRERMAELAECSVDAIVSDPPYGLVQGKKGGTGVASINLDSPYGRARIGTGQGPGGFMGCAWDSAVPGPEFWTAALRVAKPGAYLVAFGGTRTFHRLACAIEDAGWELRDTLGWLYGSGFPKNHDAAKAIDKHYGLTGETVPAGDPVKRMIPGADQNATGSWIKDNGREYQPGEYRPAHPDAVRWQGWGTALKPAWEPIILARKPLAGTVAANVLAHGTGALNIDGCRVGTEGGSTIPSGMDRYNAKNAEHGYRPGAYEQGKPPPPAPAGRWPANILHDGSDEVLAAFPDSDGQQARARTDSAAQGNSVFGALRHVINNPEPRGDSGSAARFFWSPKASTAERNLGLGPSDQNRHPTVKPIDLMAYLCRLVCPPGGVILDPFMGSGSTGIAASREGFGFIGIDLDPEHCRIARLRITGDAPLLHQGTA